MRTGVCCHGSHGHQRARKDYLGSKRQVAHDRMTGAAMATMPTAGIIDGDGTCSIRDALLDYLERPCASGLFGS